jgi:hypothetical protein
MRTQASPPMARFMMVAAPSAEYPTVPPGAVILLVGGLVVAFVPWRFVPIIGLSVGAFITVGAFVTPGTGTRLSAPEEFGPFLENACAGDGPALAVISG